MRAKLFLAVRDFMRLFCDFLTISLRFAYYFFAIFLAISVFCQASERFDLLAIVCGDWSCFIVFVLSILFSYSGIGFQGREWIRGSLILEMAVRRHFQLRWGLVWFGNTSNINGIDRTDLGEYAFGSSPSTEIDIWHTQVQFYHALSMAISTISFVGRR